MMAKYYKRGKAAGTSANGMILDTNSCPRESGVAGINQPQGWGGLSCFYFCLLIPTDAQKSMGKKRSSKVRVKKMQVIGIMKGKGNAIWLFI